LGESDARRLRAARERPVEGGGSAFEIARYRG